ncbi:UNVERIFIED_CONTAM: putative galacturonosyltransferase 4 [Sesamum latifolium]|uniref:Hexosyltransferase n=1 Tax=Sesamum latifolium TaxID=2727402 RepID=A0AAW2WMT2_9LAMI
MVHSTYGIDDRIGRRWISSASNLRANGVENRSLDENPIRQVTNEVHEAAVETEGKGPELTDWNISSVVGENDVKKEISSKHSEATSENVSNKMELKHPEHFSQTSGKDTSRKQVKSRTEKQNEQTVLPDAHIRQLKDQLIRARIYLSLSATRNNPHFIKELRLRMKEILRTLGEATKDSELPKNALEKLKAMEQTLLRGKQIQDDCATVDPSKHVFHIVTDKLNYAAMRMWFLANPPGEATIQVQNVQEFTWLNSSYSPVLRQLGSASMIDYYFKSRRAEPDSNLKFRNPKYLSIMNHLRFYLPEIFPKLDKILFLDDDIVVQRDLTGLWSLDLRGKVIGVVETCRESFHRFDRYLNFSNPLISENFNPRACGWAFGMNIFDLDEWRKQNITEVYHKWQNLNHDRLLWKLGTLPPGLITFWNRTYTLGKSWHVLGLGYDPNVPQKDIEQAAVIHYNGNLKPWLEIGIPKFRNYWAKFVDYDHMYLRECNIAP